MPCGRYITAYQQPSIVVWYECAAGSSVASASHRHASSFARSSSRSRRLLFQVPLLVYKEITDYRPAEIDCRHSAGHESWRSWWGPSLCDAVREVSVQFVHFVLVRVTGRRILFEWKKRSTDTASPPRCMEPCKWRHCNNLQLTDDSKTYNLPTPERRVHELLLVGNRL